MMRLLGAKLALGMALLCAPAQAATIQVDPVPAAGNPYLLVAGNIYRDVQSFDAGAASFSNQYTFNYVPPPELNGLISATFVILGPDFRN